VRLFAIGDLHLPSARGKDMDRFGWTGHPGPLAAAWDATVGPGDLVLVVGDISWATRAEEATDDLAWIDARAGRKVFLKGNHDYWWPDSRAKLDQILAPHRSIIGALHHGSAFQEGPYVIAGVRGWTAPKCWRVPRARCGSPACTSRRSTRTG
jgi:predicted phosphohydrolase